MYIVLGRAMSVFSVAAGITTVLGLVAFLSTLVFVYKKASLGHEQRLLEQAPAAARSRLLDEWLTRYGLTAVGLTDVQRFELIREETSRRFLLLQGKQRGFLVLSVLSIAAAAALIALSLTRTPNPEKHANSYPAGEDVSQGHRIDSTRADVNPDVEKVPKIDKAPPNDTLPPPQARPVKAAPQPQPTIAPARDLDPRTYTVPAGSASSPVARAPDLVVVVHRITVLAWHCTGGDLGLSLGFGPIRTGWRYNKRTARGEEYTVEIKRPFRNTEEITLWIDKCQGEEGWILSNILVTKADLNKGLISKITDIGDGKYDIEYSVSISRVP